jgi:hypothetical protein
MMSVGPRSSDRACLSAVTGSPAHVPPPVRGDKNATTAAVRALFPRLANGVVGRAGSAPNGSPPPATAIPGHPAVPGQPGLVRSPTFGSGTAR